MLPCTKCRKLLSEDKFGVALRYTRGRRHQCLACEAARNRAWDAANKDKRRAAYQKYAKDNPEKVRNARKRWRKNNPVAFAKHQRKAQLRRKYGIDMSIYQAMVDKQNGVCAICHQRPELRGKYPTLAVDHCHSSRQVRSLLCNNCNMGLGYFQDNPELLIMAAEYLRRWNTNSDHTSGAR